MRICALNICFVLKNEWYIKIPYVALYKRWTYRGLNKHGSLISHLSHNSQWVHRLIGFYQVHSCLHGDQDPSSPNASAAGSQQSQKR